MLTVITQIKPDITKVSIVFERDENNGKSIAYCTYLRGNKIIWCYEVHHINEKKIRVKKTKDLEKAVEFYNSL